MAYVVVIHLIMNLFAHLPSASSKSFLYDEVQGEDTEVTTKYGRLLGRRTSFTDTGIDGITDTVDQFLGVPFAQPPVGDLRFEAPRPPLPWHGVRRAVASSLVCPQLENYYSYSVIESQTEDCLYLNIYSPVQKDGKDHTYPVMYYIHGGSYTAGGAASHPAAPLALHGVVAVVINYRLGVTGFMTNGEDSFPGNYGLLDQIEGLRWVRDNIHVFRGDPKRVTIFGNSAGSGSVGLLTISPLAKGLFRYVIGQSGAPTAAWSVLRRGVDHKKRTHDIAANMSCPTMDVREMIKCLRSKPWRHFIAPQYFKGNGESYLSPLGLNYVPRVDGYVLPNYPVEALLDGPINAEAYITGVTRNEMERNLGSFVYVTKGIAADYNQIPRGLSRQVKDRIIFQAATDTYLWRKETAGVMQYAYTDWSRKDDAIRNRDLLGEFLSDLMMNAPTVDTAQRLRSRGIPVYMYQFSHRLESPPYNLSSPHHWWRTTSYHILDMNFVFGSVFVGINVENGEKQNFTEADKILSRKVMKIWTDFARTGNPTPQDGSWRQFENETTDYMDITAESFAMKQHYRAHEMALWLDLLPKIEPNANFLLLGKRVIKNEAHAHSSLHVALVCLVVFLVLALTVIGAVVIVKTTRRNHKPQRLKTMADGKAPQTAV